MQDDQRLVLEQKAGGRWFSRHEDGSSVNVGYVLEWHPFDRLVLAWQVDGNFQYDPNLICEVEVNFLVQSPGRTKVIVEHRDLDKLAGGAKVIEDMDGGWGFIMSQYKDVADAS